MRGGSKIFSPTSFQGASLAKLGSLLVSALCSAASAPVVATKGDEKKRGHTETSRDSSIEA